MALDVNGILAAVQSHASETGLFEDVVTVEPKSAPGDGLYAAIWVDNLAPVAAGSGLNAVSTALTLTVRIMKRMLSQPYGQIDPEILTAADTLLRAYAGAFTLDGKVRNVDLFGMYGSRMEGQAGYLSLDKAMFRIFEITLPLTISDLWAEVP